MHYLTATSPNKWTDNSLDLHYIKHYNKYIKHFVEDSNGKIQQYCMLLMDNYLSHFTWQFVEYALAHKIVLITLSLYLIYKLQPLDVGYFGPLFHYYRKQIDDFC